MAKPQEVLIYIDEYGIPQKQFQENTEQNSSNESLNDLLIQLSKLDWEDMKAIMTAKLDRFIDGSEWSFDSLNSLCWSIGAIGGTLPDDVEKQFLILTIRTLLNLVELKKGKENKAVVASNIMFYFQFNIQTICKQGILSDNILNSQNLIGTFQKQLLRNYLNLCMKPFLA